MFDSPAFLLAAGGVAAAVTAGWQKIRSMFNSLSRILVVTASIDGPNPLLRYAVRRLKEEYTLLPTGSHFFSISQMETKHKGTIFVPFKLLNKTVVFSKWSGWKPVFIICSYTGHNVLNITTVRGMLDIDAFVTDTTEAYESWSIQQYTSTSGLSSFQIHRVIGSEKNMAAAMTAELRQRGHKTEAVSDAVSLSSSDSSGLTQGLDKSYDTYLRHSIEDWSPTAEQQDPLESLFFPQDILEHFNQVKSWFNARTWYEDRGIPWRRGWLLYGPGGTGKSSMSRAVAELLGIPLYQFYLGTLSDQEFISEWRSMSFPCVVLFEDLDNVFHGRTNVTDHKSLSFDTLLNQISGVSTSNGVMLVITTNDISKIDPALGVSCETAQLSGVSCMSSRPGRIDSVIYVGYIQHAERVSMVQRTLKDWPETWDALVNIPGDITPAQFQDLCIREALNRCQHH